MRPPRRESLEGRALSQVLEMRDDEQPVREDVDVLKEQQEPFAALRCMGKPVLVSLLHRHSGLFC